jgi:uncharacterized protein (DUF433 family)
MMRSVCAFADIYYWEGDKSMDLNEVIKLKKDLSVTDLSGEKVMIDFDSGKYFMIKGAGNDIWDIIQEEITVGEIIDRLLKDYDISREDCEKSVAAFLGKLKELEFI